MPEGRVELPWVAPADFESAAYAISPLRQRCGAKDCSRSLSCLRDAGGTGRGSASMSKYGVYGRRSGGVAFECVERGNWALEHGGSVCRPTHSRIGVTRVRTTNWAERSISRDVDHQMIHHCLAHCSVVVMQPRALAVATSRPGLSEIGRREMGRHDSRRTPTRTARAG